MPSNDPSNDEADFRVLNLNSASEEELANSPIIGPVRAKALYQARPFRGWSDVERIPGIGKGVADDLRSRGAQLRNRYQRKQSDRSERSSENLGARAYQVGGRDPAISETPPKSQVGPIPTDDQVRKK